MKHATKILAGAATVAAALMAIGCSAEGYTTFDENGNPGQIEWKSAGSGGEPSSASAE
jgi:hypothetical protein